MSVVFDVISSVMTWLRKSEQEGRPHPNPNPKTKGTLLHKITKLKSGAWKGVQRERVNEYSCGSSKLRTLGPGALNYRNYSPAGERHD